MMPAPMAGSSTWLTLVLPIVFASQGMLTSLPTHMGRCSPSSCVPGPAITGPVSSNFPADVASPCCRDCRPGLWPKGRASFVPRLRGGTGAQDTEEDEAGGAVPDEAAVAISADDLKMTMEEQMEKMGINLNQVMPGGSVQKALTIPEDVPDGWDPDADWGLRVAGRNWWKEQRGESRIMKFPTVKERFFEAIRIGAVPWVREMLDGEGSWGGKVDVMERDVRLSGWTGLHHAAQRGNLETAKLLLAAGADPKAECIEWKGTPLHTAAAYGRTNMCKLLIEAGADVNAMDSYNDTAVDECVRFKREETALYLMGPDVGGKSARLSREDVEKKSVWIKDPLWPDGYNKDLLADSSVEKEEEEDSTVDDDVHTSELERQIWLCSDNKTFAETLVEMADAIPEDKWAEEPPRGEYAITKEMMPEMQDEMAVEEVPMGIDPDTSSGWGELDKLRIPDKKEGDETSSELPATIFKGEAPGGDLAGMPQGQGIFVGGEVSTAEESDITARAGTINKAKERAQEADVGDGEKASESSSWSESSSED